MRRIWLIGLLAMLGLAALMATFGLGSVRASSERGDAERWRVHTLGVLIDAKALSAAVRDMQSGQRGYLLTLDQDYLAPYRSGSRNARALLMKLKRETADNPRQQNNLTALAEMVGRLESALARRIDLAQTGQPQAAIALVRTGEGRRIMEAIDERLAAIIAEENALLIPRTEAALRADGEVRNYSFFLILVGAALLASSALFGAIALRRHNQRAEIDALMRSVMRSVEGAVFAKNAAGRYTSMSEVGARLFGRPVEDILGRTDTEIQPPLFATVVHIHDAAAKRNDGPMTFDETIDSPNGTLLLSTTRTPVHFPDGIGIAGVAIDVTQRRSADAELVRAQAEERAVFDLAAIGIAQADPATRRLIRVNAKLTEITGYSAEELTAMTTDALTHPDDRKADREGFMRLVATEKPFQTETRYLRKDGSTALVRTNFTLAKAPDGTPLGTVATVEEITNLRRTETELSETGSMLRAIIEATPGLIYAKDTAGRMILANGPALALIGKPWAEVEGRTDSEFLDDPEQGEMIMQNDRRIMDAGIVQTIEEQVSLPDGSPCTWLSTKAPLHDAGGRIIGLVGVSVDITTRKDLEGELRGINETMAARVTEAVEARETALAQLHEAQKLETIGQLTGGVAHDFNNLLTPIVGCLDLLRRRMPEDDAKSQRLISGALQSAERARVLVARLLSFARRQKLEPQAVDLWSLTTGIDELIRRSLGPTIEIVINVPTELPAAFVDPNQLELALLNLSVNARDAMPEGGKLTIEAEAVTIPPNHAQGLPLGQYTLLRVSDTGTGMDEVTQRRALEPFYSTKEQGKGTGLGLSMAHGLAAQSGGLLTVHSKLGEGTRIDILFPASVEKASTTLAVQARPIAASKPISVLVVDDEELVRQGTSDLLTDLGHTVAQASSGAQALAMLRSGTECDLLLTDYLMPSMSGVEVVMEARKIRPELPVLIITGFANMAESAHRDLPWIAKPFRQTDLAAKVAELTA